MYKYTIILLKSTNSNNYFILKYFKIAFYGDVIVLFRNLSKLFV